MIYWIYVASALVRFKGGRLMFCSNCGKELPESSAFCSKCGMNLKAGTVPPQPASAAKAWVIALAIVLAASFTCIAVVILFDRLTTDNHDGKPSNTSNADVAADDTGSEDTLQPSNDMDLVADKAVVGLWSTEGPSGTLVDPVTGYASGSIYNGEWYLFRNDGTYRYVIISSGIVLDGGVVCEGRYTINNKSGELLLTDIKESWYPNPASAGQKEAYKNKSTDDITVQYQYGDDENTLIINNSDVFTKVES